MTRLLVVKQTPIEKEIEIRRKMNYQSGIHGQITPQAFYNSLPINNEPIQVYQERTWIPTPPGQALPSFQSISPQVRMPLQYQIPSAQGQQIQQIHPSLQRQTHPELPRMPMTRPQPPLQHFHYHYQARPQYCPPMNQGIPQVVPHRPAWQGSPALPQVPVRSMKIEDQGPPALPQVPFQPMKIEDQGPPALPQVPVQPMKIESQGPPALPQVPIQTIKIESQEDENEVIESMFNEIVNEVHRIEEEQNLPKIHFHTRPGEAYQNHENCRLM